MFNDMHQERDKVQSLIWRIKFYNGERKAHSLVRSLKYSALVCSLALELIPDVGHYAQQQVFSLMRRNASCGD